MTPRALVIDDCAALVLGVVLAPVALWRAVRRIVRRCVWGRR